MSKVRRLVRRLVCILILAVLVTPNVVQAAGKRITHSSTAVFYYQVVNPRTGELKILPKAEYDALLAARRKSPSPYDATSDLGYLTLQLYVTYNTPVGTGNGPDIEFYGTWNWSTVVCGDNYPGLAWNGNLALYKTSYYWWLSTGSAGTLYQKQVTPGAGIVWQEDPSPMGCDVVIVGDKSGGVTADVDQIGWKNQYGNVVFQFFHTTSSLTYSFSISGSGPSMSISPTTSQSSLAIYQQFTY